MFFIIFGSDSSEPENASRAAENSENERHQDHNLSSKIVRRRKNHCYPKLGIWSTITPMLSRTKKKLDLFLVETLETISGNIKSAYEYIKIPKDDEDFEIKNDCKEALEILDEIRKKVSSIDDLSDLSEDDIGFVYECLSLYEGEFVISHLDSETRKQNEYDYKKLQKLLNLFY